MSADQLPSLNNPPAAPVEQKRGRAKGSCNRSKAIDSHCTACTAPEQTGASLATVVRDQLSEMLAELLPMVESEDNRLIKIITKQNSVPSPVDLAYFEKAGYNVNQVCPESETGFYRDGLYRMTRVLNDQQIAGTSATRAELASEASQAQAALNTRGAELQEQIRRAEAELVTLQRSVETTQKRAQEASQAAERNRARLHPKLRKSVDYLKAYLNKQHRAPFANGIDARKKFLEMISTTMDHNSIIEHCKSLPSDHYAHYDGRPIPQSTWERLVSEYRAELKELLPEWQAIKNDLDEGYRELNAYCDFYVA